MKGSSGRHGGNQGRNDRHEAKQASTAVRNTDVDSLRHVREQEKAEGHTSGHRE
jgi:hypothetical protein